MAAKTTFSVRPDDPQVLGWQHGTPKSHIIETPAPPQGITKITINQSAGPVVVSHVKSDLKDEERISTKAVIGTLLGASAGAAIAYAMVKSEDEKSLPASEKKQVIYRPIEASGPYATENAVVVESPFRGPIVRRVDPSDTHRVIPDPRVSTVVSSAHTKREAQSEYIRSAHPNPAPSSHTGRTIARTSNTKVLAGPDPSRASFSSSRQTHQQSLSKHDSRPASPTVYTTTKSAKDVPLPASRVSTSRSLQAAAEAEGDTDHLEGTIVPDDSISQVSTNVPDRHESSRSKSKRSSHHRPSGGGSGGSSRRISHHTRQGSHTRRSSVSQTGSRWGDRSIMGIPLRPKTSAGSGSRH